MKKLILFFAFAVFAFTPCSAQQADNKERILGFQSILTVREDASVHVREHIMVNAQHKEINRGIVRVIPSSMRHPVKVLSLYKDGQPHPYFTEKTALIDGNLEINFGNDDLLEKGIHMYILEYTMENAAGFFKKYDEIYWNVTGNDWIFPIDSAYFSVTLPPGARVIEDSISIYTGKRGDKKEDARRLETEPGKLEFITTKPISPGEGLTVAVPFAKGAVKKPFKEYLFNFFWLVFVILITTCVPIYYIVTWRRVGSSLREEPYVTEFTPPPGISPAFSRYILKKDADHRAFTTALISLAMKGKIEIATSETFYPEELKNKALGTISTTIFSAKDRDTAGLSSEEELIMQNLFMHGDTFPLSLANGGKLSKCEKEFAKKLQENGKLYIIKNGKYLIFPSIMLFFLAFTLFFTAPLAFFANIFYGIAFASVVGIKNKNGKIIGLAILNAVMFAALYGIYSAPFLMLSEGNTWMLFEASFLISIWGLAVYSIYIDNVTPAGQELLNKIKGFRRYMSVAEEHRVALSNPVDAERIFADYLPYAFAFKMENKWIKEFDGVISAAKVEEYTRRAGGRNFVRRNSLSRAISATRPSSSGSGGSGSRSGGSSGGGRGGGGGRGR